jgi:hypothetical protein
VTGKNNQACECGDQAGCENACFCIIQIMDNKKQIAAYDGTETNQPKQKKSARPGIDEIGWNLTLLIRYQLKCGISAATAIF